MIKTIGFIIMAIIVAFLAFVIGYNLRFIKIRHIGNLYFDGDECFMEYLLPIEEVKSCKNGYVRIKKTRKNQTL